MPQPSIEHDAIRKRRQVGAGGFAVVLEADAPRPGKRGGGNVVCACKVFSFIAGMGERQTNFFKNWLHELKVLEYLSTRPECLVVGFYGYSLKHESVSPLRNLNLVSKPYIPGPYEPSSEDRAPERCLLSAVRRQDHSSDLHGAHERRFATG